MRPSCNHQDVVLSLLPGHQSFTGERPKIEVRLVFFQTCPPFADGSILCCSLELDGLSRISLCDDGKWTDQFADFQNRCDARGLHHNKPGVTNDVLGCEILGHDKVGKALRSGGRRRVEFVDHLLEGDREGGFVLVGMGADEFDDLAVAVCRGLLLAACLVDHPEAVVSVMDLGVVFKERPSGLIGFIELAFVDEIDHGVGVAGQFVCDIVHKIAAVLAVVMAVVMIVGVPCRLGGASLGRGFERGARGFLILRQAAALVFLPTATRAGIITSDLGHDFRERAAMCQRVLSDAAFYRLLLRVDEDMATAEQRQRCPACGAALHAGHFARKPRGVPAGVGEDYRKRRMPPSVRFLGPKVYPFAVVVLISAMRCGPSRKRIRELQELIGVSRHTVMRWSKWWREMLPETHFWRATGRTLMPPVSVQELPASLLERFAGAPAERLLLLLRWLSPISTGSPAVHAA